MNKLIKLILFIIKSIIFIILLPFQIVRYTFIFIKNFFKFIFKNFMKLFKFSLSFKITFLYFSLGLITLFIICSSFLFGLREFLIYTTSEEIYKDLEIVSTYIETNKEIDSNTLEKYISGKNHIKVFKNDKEVFNYKSINTINQNLPFSLNIDLNYSRDLNDIVKIDSLTYKIEIKSNFHDFLLILEIAYILTIFISSIMLILTIILSGGFSKNMFKPIHEITSSAKNITGKNLEKRINVSNSFDELKELGETFNEMLDRIEKSYEKQKQFVNDASHELRTPLAVIQGYINMLDRWGKDDKEILEESIEAIKNESEQMNHLITSLLFLARMDKGTQQLNYEEFHIDELINDIVKETRLIDSEHKVINNNESSLIINADKSLLKQSIRILVENSIKYTEKDGEIILNSYSEDNYIYLTIKDNGIGISKEDLPYIFNRFYRADSSRTKNTGGTGLGLSIAKWIITSHNGEIKVRSALGLGTKFIIKLPYTK